MLWINIITDPVSEKLVFDLFEQGFFLGNLLFDLCLIFGNTCKPLFEFSTHGGLNFFS